MRYSVIENGKVVNQAEADETFATQMGWIPAGTEAIGDMWDGEAFTKPAIPIVVPQVVTMAQARKALELADVSDVMVNASIDNIADPKQRKLARIDWEYSGTVRRDSPLVAQLGPTLGLAEAQIDQLFVTAAGL